MKNEKRREEKGGMKMKQTICILSVLVLITAANCASNGNRSSSDDPAYQLVAQKVPPMTP